MGRGAPRGDERRAASRGARGAEGGREARHAVPTHGKDDSGRCSRTSTPTCPGTSPSSASRRSAEAQRLMADDEHDPGAELRPQGDDGARRRRRRVRRGCRLFRRRVPRHRGAAEANTARRACFDAPISEGGIIATAVGMAAYGLRRWPRSSSPITSIPATTRSSREAAQDALPHRRRMAVPMTIRTPYGGGIFGGQTHSQSPESAVRPYRRPEDGDPVQPRTTPRAC